MLTPGDTVVVGVSGGADSLGLLYILTELSEYGLRLIVSHLNHGIRPIEAKRDADFVERIAKGMGLIFELKEVDTIGFKRTSKLSLEEAGRVLRYGFFKEVLDKYKAQRIATAHTLDDQAETVLMRLIKGSGPLGLSGIPPVSEGYIIRPLIETRRSEIECYLRSKGINWVEDSTNRAMVFLRNRIRHDLIPRLERYNPRIKETLARAASIFRVEEDFIRSEAERAFKYVFDRENDELIGIVSRYKAIPEGLRLSVLRIAIEKLKGDLRRISSTHVFSVDEILSSQSPSGEVSLPDRLVVAKGYDLLLVTRRSRLKPEFSYIVPSTGRWDFPHVEIEVEIRGVESFDEDRFTAFFDIDSVGFPIEIRNLHPGDRFIPLGMKTMKKVKDFFIDEKVPRFLRYRTPIFLSRGEIMWIGGMRIDDRFKVKGKEALSIRIIRPRW